MSEISKSIWKQTSKGTWALFFNISPQSQTTQELFTPETPELSKYISLIQSPQSVPKLGTLIMTPKGFGRIIKQDSSSATVSFSNPESSSIFPLSEVSNLFYVYVKYYNQNISNWYKLFLPTTFTIEQFKNILDELKIVPFSKRNFLMVSNGVEIKDNKSFESIGIKNGSKIIIFSQKETQNKVSRFSSTLQWWYSYSLDGITFTCNKKIRINGVGLYGSHEGKVQVGTIRILEGTNYGSVLYEEAIEVQPVDCSTSSIVPIMFKKSTAIRPDISYTIQFITHMHVYLYYGINGKINVEGDKGVQFTFSFTPNSPHGSGVESGNFPEIYYNL